MQSTVNIHDQVLPIEKVYHPSVDVNQKDKLKYIAFAGSENTVAYQFPASSLSNSQIIFNVVMPSVKNVLDRKLYARFEFSVQFNLVANSGGMNVAGYGNSSLAPTWGIAQYPISGRCTSTLSVDLNSSRFSTNPSTIASALSYYKQNELFQRTSKSQAGGMRDLVQNDQYIAFGNYNRNMYAPYYQNDIEETRNILNYCTYVESNDRTGPVGTIYNGYVYPDINPQYISGSDTSSSVTFLFQTTEPVVVSPFTGSNAEELPGLYNLNNLQITYELSNLIRAIEGYPSTINFNGTAGITSVNVNMKSATLLANIYTLHLSYDIPKQAFWSIYDIQRFIQTSNSTIPAIAAPAGTGNITPANTPFTINSQVINFSSHPKYIYIFVKPSEVYEQMNNGCTLNSTFARITNLNITYCNKLVLQSFTEEQLMNLCARNAYTSQWSMYRAFTGSVICLDVSTDLSLPDNETSGVGAGQYSFICQATCLRPNSLSGSIGFNGAAAQANMTFDLVIVSVQEGYLTSDSDSVFKTIVGPLRREMIAAAPTAHGMYQHYNSWYKLFTGSGDSVVVQKAGLLAPSKLNMALAKHAEEDRHEREGGRLLSVRDIKRKVQHLR